MHTCQTQVRGHAHNRAVCQIVFQVAVVFGEDEVLGSVMLKVSSLV